MKRFFAALSLAFFSACVGPMMIRTDEIKGTMMDVIVRHDDYVAADLVPPPELKDAYLAQSQELRQLLANEEIEPTRFHTLADPVTQRHDTYVSNDPTLTPLEKRVYLRSSLLLLDIGR